MNTQKKQLFKASLVKYREAHMKEPIWFWVNLNTGTAISPKFSDSTEAERWFDTVVDIHSKTYDLLERTMYGKFYTLKGKIDIGNIISSKKANECTFDMDLEDDILSIKVLGINIEDARKRVEEYIEILEWLE